MCVGKLMKLCQIIHMSFICFDKEKNILRRTTAVEYENFVDILTLVRISATISFAKSGCDVRHIFQKI